MVGSNSVETAVRVEDESRAGKAAGIGGNSLTSTDGNSEISADAGRRAEARGPYSSLRPYSLILSSEELTATSLVSSVETPQVWGKNHEYLQLTQDVVLLYIYNTAWEGDNLAPHVITVKPNFVWTNIGEMPGLTALMTCRDLRVVFNKDLMFAEQQKTRDRLEDVNTVMPQAIVNIGGE